MSELRDVDLNEYFNTFAEYEFDVIDSVKLVYCV